eukprot:TRINITY_DN10155_c0_g1_i1.p1 TRINITY_DN10155_c0_g1~~TRINITY_DN10155_c0_g1_i1.p1  ORF type:complete len:1287 (-),score=355.22 TRINITY_DN10155_c0_g1_i1:585-4343(-)
MEVTKTKTKGDDGKIGKKPTEKHDKKGDDGKVGKKPTEKSDKKGGDDEVDRTKTDKSDIKKTKSKQDKKDGGDAEEDAMKKKPTMMKPLEDEVEAERADAQDWELQQFPKIDDREPIQAKVDPERRQQMHEEAVKKITESKQKEDPATFKRRFKFHFGVIALENLTATPIEIFLAVCKLGPSDAKKNRMKLKYHFTKSYQLVPDKIKQLKKEEVCYDKKEECSYEDMYKKEVSLDVWSVSTMSFNQHLGVARRCYYDLGNTNMFQSIPIFQDDEKLIGRVHVKALITETFEFNIQASNWNFTPKPEFVGKPDAQKKLKIGIPSGPGQSEDTKETKFTKGPRYYWPNVGEFKYVGTAASLAQEAFTVAVMTKEGCQGKAVVSLASAGDYPIAQGTLKKLSKASSEYVQGRVGGSLAVEKRSQILKKDQVDEDSSIPPPCHLLTTLITNYLNPKGQYLVVELHSAQNLPVADVDTGTSNPFVRVKYDGVVQQTEFLEANLNPVFSSTFYFPIRVPDEKIRTSKEYYNSLLPVEMQSKGYLEVELWHMEGTPTEFLGAARIDLSSTRFGEEAQKAICHNITKPPKEKKSKDKEKKDDKDKGKDDKGKAEESKESKAESQDEEEEDDDEPDLTMGINRGLAKRHKTRVLSLQKEKISGTWLQQVGKASVSLDCYFVPDFPDDFKFLQQDNNQQRNTTSRFQQSFSQWDDHWVEFKKAYKAWFPDAYEGRRFLYKYTDANSEEMPLVKLISPLALPASLEEPQSVLHWTRCIEFTVPPRQRSLGEMSNWCPVETLLSIRKGTVQDHAVVLCCALTGLRKDAFVCKGTLQDGKEHAWVMTREDGGVVTFWETTTGCKYHLPSRWIGEVHTNKSKQAALDRWKARKVVPKWMELASRRAAFNRSQHIQFMDDLAKLPIAPWKELYHGENVVVVPYDTIEVVFNSEQLWGNLGNAHPACIHYDMEDDRHSWLPLIIEDQLKLVSEWKGIVIPVGPCLTPNAAMAMDEHFERELMECIRMVRMRIGFESYFVTDAVLQSTLEEYLIHLEDEARLDVDWCPKVKKPWSIPSPFDNKDYKKKCKEAWKSHAEKKKQLAEDRKQLPVKPNYVLSGMPIHFSSCDLKEIRTQLMQIEPLQDYLNIQHDDVLFFVCCKMFPMASSVSSTWIFFGAQVPLPADVVQELAEKELKNQLAGTATGEDAGDEEGKKGKKKKKESKDKDKKDKKEKKEKKARKGRDSDDEDDGKEVEASKSGKSKKSKDGG